MEIYGPFMRNCLVEAGMLKVNCFCFFFAINFHVPFAFLRNLMFGVDLHFSFAFFALDLQHVLERHFLQI